MLARVNCATLLGIEAVPVQVEAHISIGLPCFSIVGLPDTAVQEARERVRAAIINSSLEFPLRRITVNLAPADIKKEGPVFDLPLALAILSAIGEFPSERLSENLFVGELALDGSLRSVKGAISYAQMAKELGYSGIVVPALDAFEASLITGIQVYGVDSLSQVAGWLKGERSLHPFDPGMHSPAEHDALHDFAMVKGQAHAKRALEIAATGGHNVLLVGAPGSGKTMLMKCLAGILPKMRLDESLEVTRIYSVSGLVPREEPLITKRPFRAPHHTISAIGLIGGGTHAPRPGEVSLSHNGVLFLDEILEFSRHVLDVLRQPIEDGFVTISRRVNTVTYPARFLLAAAANPCKCGYLGDQQRECSCLPRHVLEYRSRLSGPLIDRVDIQIEMPRLTSSELTRIGSAEPTASIRRRVEAARLLAGERRGPVEASREARRFLAEAVDKLGLTARGYERVLRVSRTIADLEQCEGPVHMGHVAEALQYRLFERRSYAREARYIGR